MADVDLSEAQVFADERHPEDRWFVLPDGRVWFRLGGGELVPAIMTAVDVAGSHWLREVTENQV